VQGASWAALEVPLVAMPPMHSLLWLCSRCVRTPPPPNGRRGTSLPGGGGARWLVRFPGDRNFLKKIIAALARELVFDPSSVSLGWPHCGQAYYMLRGIVVKSLGANLVLDHWFLF
jgi:hypothetical protein